MFGTPKAGSLLGRTPLISASATRRSLHTTPRTAPTAPSRSEQVLEETSGYVVKALNSPVPVQVQEALRGDIRGATVKLHDSGWAWLVAGNRLLLWKFSTTHFTVHCKQVSLPVSSAVVSTWTADLVTVCVLPGSTDSSISLMAASPEGKLYYWSNVLRDTPTVTEATADVGGGYSFTLTSLAGCSGCLLATTQGGLFLVSLPLITQAGLVVRQLQIPRGMLSGFGRRVSSLFFGSQPEREAQEVRRVLTTFSGTSQKDVVFVLTSAGLQKWFIGDTHEQLVYDAALEEMIKDAVGQNNWFSQPRAGESSVSSPQLSLWIVDMQLARGFVAVLFAVSSDGMSAEYGLAFVQADSDVSPLTVDRLFRMNHGISCRPPGQRAVLTYQLHGAVFSSTVMAYNRNTVVLTDVNQAALRGGPDLVNFPPPNRIIGTGSLNEQLLFFTLNHGVISLSTQSPAGSGRVHVPMTHPSASLLITPTATTPMALSHLSTESASHNAEMLKNAFLEYLEHNTERAAMVRDQLFPHEPLPGHEVPGDRAVITLSEMLVNELPTQDPRWGDTSTRDISTTSGSSLIIIYQLEDKLEAHRKYLHFLTDTSILDKLSCVHVRGQLMSTCQLLCEHAEKITAAISLRKMHNQLVDRAIKLALQSRPSPPPAHPLGFTNQDTFYSQVSSIDDIIPALLTHQGHALQSLEGPQERLHLLLSVSSVLRGLLQEALHHRQTMATLYRPHPPSTTDTGGGEREPEFLPWSASAEMRNCLSQQLQVLLDVGLRDADSSQDRQSLWDLTASLCDLLYGGYWSQLQSMQNRTSQSSRLSEIKRNFEADRRFLLSFLEHGEYRYAAELGERYEDFYVLTQLCEQLNDREKLRQYMTRFSEQGFSDFLFKKYLDQGQLRQLLSHSEDFPGELGEFLEPHDNLSWIHQVATQDYTKAQRSLLRLAERENIYVQKKKTLLSLSKLAVLSSDASSGEKAAEMESLNCQLDTIEYQEGVPTEAIEACGLDPTSMPPLPPQELIELYVGEHNPDSDPEHFLLALELLDLTFPDRGSEESQELRTYIWSQAILKDDWSRLTTDKPLEQVRMTFFIRTAEEAFGRGLNLLLLLPELEVLLSSRRLVASGLAADSNFQFLIRASYEQIERVQNASGGAFEESFVEHSS